MIWIAIGLAVWLLGAGVAWAFVAGAARSSREPFRPLEDLRDLAGAA